ncbi:hypothetical protein ACKLNR_013806 [Fusarium oxysporum f. sp. zingiberi]
MVRLKTAASFGLALWLSGHIGSVIADCSNKETLTITEVTQVSSLAASCPTYTGDLHLINVTETINMTGVKTLIGEIKYNNDFPDDYVTFYSSTLKNVTGSLLMYGAGEKTTKAPGDLNITLPALRSIGGLAAYWGWGDVSINTDPKLNILSGLKINSGGSQSSAGNLYFNVTSAWRIDVSGVEFQATGGALFKSSAQRVTSGIGIWGSSGLERVVLDNLKFVNYTVSITSNPDLDYISLSLPEVGLLRATENGRDTHLSVPNLKKLGGRSDPGTYTSGGDAGGIFRDLVNASLPLLTEVHGDEVDWFKGKLNFTSNFFSELSLPSLKTANCTLGIDENIALNDFSIPRLNYVKDLQIHDNPRLLNFTANLLKKADNINMTGPFTNVEFFGLEVITGDFYLAGDKTMDCSWFDEHFLNDIVQGSYKCVGNHTKPATERKPSTPTDEADLRDKESEQGGSSSSGNEEGSGSRSDSGLSTGAKAGIGAGVGVAGLILLGLGAGFLIGKKTKRSPGAIAHTSDSGYQKAELDGDVKPSGGVKEAHSVEASEMQDTERITSQLEDFGQETMVSSPYQPLRSSNGQIRLLILHPAFQHDAPIRCLLEPAFLSSNPDFEALSYTWGGPGNSCNISLGNHDFLVEDNAAAALRRLRWKMKKRVLWIDAICINQADVDEKNEQVPLMQKIYGQAQNVLVWLGEPTDGSILGMRLLQNRMASVGWHQWKIDQTYGKPTLPFFKSVNSSIAMMHRSRLIQEQINGEVREFLDRPWWRRTWIIQEVVLAKNIQIICGDEVVTWDTVASLLKRLRMTQAEVQVFGVKLSDRNVFPDRMYNLISGYHQKWHSTAGRLELLDVLY